jgi:pimeloyl-ACP methyl ester carboxylesterase
MRLDAWTPQIAAFAPTHRVIAVDMPGHGESERIAEGAALPDFVAWFERVLDDLALARANVAGHSMGALIAGGMAATLGARVKRVALVNGVYRRDANARAAVVARAEAIRSGHFDCEGPLRRWFGAGSEDTEVYRSTRGWLSAVDPAGYTTAYAAFARGDEVYADAWPSIICPALFLTGDGDSNSTPAMARAMAQAAPRGRAHIVKGHRHMVNLTAPEEVNDALADWLSQDEASPDAGSTEGRFRIEAD